MSALPTFFVIGAAKAGTTSLHAYLDRHPDIQMSAVKEPRFFVADPGEAVASSGRIADRAAYEALFDPAVPHRGESSTSYALFPLYRDVPARIHAAVPDARLVYLVRDPVERAVSHYQQAFFAGTAFEDVATAFAEPEAPGHPYVCASRYATQLEPYLACFDRDRVHVVDSTRLADAVPGIVAFLGADPARLPAELGAPRNVTEGKRVETGALARLRRAGVAGHVPAPLKAAARRMLTRATAPPVPDPAALDRLRAHLAPEADRLRDLTGDAYPTWTV